MPAEETIVDVEFDTPNSWNCWACNWYSRFHGEHAARDAERSAREHCDSGQHRRRVEVLGRLAAAEAARDRALAEVEHERRLSRDRLRVLWKAVHDSSEAPEWWDISEDELICAVQDMHKGPECDAALVAAVEAAWLRIADLEATDERVNVVLDSWEKCPDSTLSWAATVFRNQLAQDTARKDDACTCPHGHQGIARYLDCACPRHGADTARDETGGEG